MRSLREALLTLGSSSEIPDSLWLGHKFTAAGSQQSGRERSFPVSPRERVGPQHQPECLQQPGCEEGQQPQVPIAVTFPPTVRKVTARLSLAKRREVSKITLEEISCLISMNENSEFTKPGKIKFFCRSRPLNLGFLAVF